MSNISNFAKNFKGGVRPNQFRVSILGSPVGGIPLEFLGKATSIPASTIGNMDVPYRGRQLKVPGDRTFEDWTVTCFSDGSWAVRSTFERWMQAISGHTNIGSNVASNAVYGTGRVEQLDQNGRTLALYQVEGIYPTNLAAIDLDFGTNDTPEEFQVTFAINNWRNTALPTITGNGGNSSVDIGFNMNLPGGVNVSGNTGFGA
tara:strand:- start:9779 stop:10387 length:609 start_codon:yes stop_codon:yes gene_type:complete